MSSQWTFNEYDRKAAEEINSFLPNKIYDIHAHIWRTNDLNVTEKSIWTEGPDEVSIAVWRKHLTEFMGGKCPEGGLFFPVPKRESDAMMQNDYIINQLELEPLCRGLILVSPKHSCQEIVKYLDHPQVVGFKVYHTYSDESPTWQSSIKGFSPEWIWELADHRGLVLMLHMVRDKAVLDPENIREIRELCTRFPRVKLILAHAGRCFHAPNAEGVKQLRGVENVWFDTSGICEPEALKVILQQFGPSRLIWGSDFPVTQIRGKSVTVGNGFVWLDEEFCNWEQASHLCNPILSAFEMIRALKQASVQLGLNAEDLNEIFYNNAVRLLQLKDEAMNRTEELYRHAKQRIPGGVQLLSKRPELMAPGLWPAYFKEARGCEVWDLDGRHYYDMSTNAVGSCLLGYGDPDVTSAVVRRVNLGSMCSLNAPEEVELADMLCDTHPWAEQVRFTRGGGESCAVAIRIARATTDRSIVAICGYHGWHDWYLSANLGESDALRGHLLSGLEPLGVPRELRGTVRTFQYNDLKTFQEIIDLYGNQLAAVIMEPCRNEAPQDGFLERVRSETRKCGAMLIFDEISIGWRYHQGGAHLKLGVTPDIAVFSKAMGNGHPIGAIVGTKEAMNGAHLSFISSTYWTESIGPAAAVVTIRKLGELKVQSHVEQIGKNVMESWHRHAETYQLPIQINRAYPCLAHFQFEHEQSDSLRTLYTQKMLALGFLAGTSFYPTFAHNEDIVAEFDHAVEKIFREISMDLDSGNIENRLLGGIASKGFQRLT